jgi:hypothetical protein
MKLRVYALAAVMLSLFLAGPAVTQGAPKKVMVHYMPWFVTQPVSGSWGWHWTMNHYNPAKINPTNGQAEIASWYYPLIGPYDSADPAVLEYHVLLMKLAGIDGVIVDWYGMDNYNDYAVNNERTLDLFNYTRKAGLDFSLCYEDATLQQEVKGGFIKAADAVAHAQETMLYAQSNFFNDRSFLRWKNSPVLLNFGPQYFHSGAEWASAFSVLAPSNHPAFFTEDNRVEPAGAGAFDWPPMWMSRAAPQSPAQPLLSDAMAADYLTAFEAKAGRWPAFVSSAFPRFRDIYAQAGVSTSFGFLDDQNGATFQKTLARAMTNDSAFVQVVTWNDFGEGTVVEPTVQFGYRDLAAIQDLRRQYLTPAFSFRTNDLLLPLRLYHVRKHYGSSDPVLSAEMDRIFTDIVSGNLAAADVQLSGLESNAVVIYNASATTDQLQFSIGGFLSRSGVQVQTSPALAGADWTTITNFTIGTNSVVFSASIPPDFPAMYFKVQSARQ